MVAIEDARGGDQSVAGDHGLYGDPTFNVGEARKQRIRWRRRGDHIGGHHTGGDAGITLTGKIARGQIAGATGWVGG